MPVQILIVDDIESNLVALDALLQDPELRVVRAHSGKEALEALQRSEFSLVLLDVQMPEMDGFDTAAAMRLQETTRSVPIMFVTAHGSTKEKLAKAYSIGAADFLEKPIDPAALRAKVRTIVELWRRAEDAKRDAEKKHQEELIAERVRWEAEERVRRETEELRRHAAEQESAAAAAHRGRREAEDANRVKDEFLATLSHELRTPLNAIMGWTAILRKKRTDPTAVDRAVEVIDRNAKAQSKLIDDMLDVSRIVAGKLRLDARLVLLVPLVERAVESFRPAAEEKGIVIDMVVTGEIQATSGDPDRIRQVVENLISNAVKFTSPGGRIDVRLGRNGSRACLEIRDSGAGIAAEFLPHVFERFRQADGASTRSHGGLGVGLALAKHLVELHGGTIAVASEGLGRGSTFSVELPIRAVSANQPDAMTNLSDEAPRSLANLRILVVDDDEDARDVVREVLELAGATVVAVGSAGLAVASVSSWRPDLIISDIGMPEMDGYALLRSIRGMPAEQGGQTPAVALTAYASPDDAERARRAGFQVFLTKPVDAARLVGEIAGLAAACRP